MSYCRVGSDSELYLINSGKEFLCMACPLLERASSMSLKTHMEALYHLADHVMVGHTVPIRAFVRLIKEIGEQERPLSESTQLLRCTLIDKEVDGAVTADELLLLQYLQRVMLRHRKTVAPLPIEEARAFLEEMSRPIEDKNNG